MNTTENNKLIADWLGFEPCQVRKRKSGKYDYHLPEGFDLIKEDEWSEMLVEQDYCKAEDLKFHKDWNWLMPVVEKINGFTDENGLFLYEVNINASRCEIERPTGLGNIVNEHGASTIEMVYIAVVEFIEWHNQSFTN